MPDEELDDELLELDELELEDDEELELEDDEELELDELELEEEELLDDEPVGSVSPPQAVTRTSVTREIKMDALFFIVVVHRCY